MGRGDAGGGAAAAAEAAAAGQEDIVHPERVLAVQEHSMTADGSLGGAEDPECSADKEKRREEAEEALEGKV